MNFRRKKPSLTASPLLCHRPDTIDTMGRPVHARHFVVFATRLTPEQESPWNSDLGPLLEFQLDGNAGFSA